MRPVPSSNDRADRGAVSSRMMFAGVPMALAGSLALTLTAGPAQAAGVVVRSLERVASDLGCGRILPDTANVVPAGGPRDRPAEGAQ